MHIDILATQIEGYNWLRNRLADMIGRHKDNKSDWPAFSLKLFDWASDIFHFTNIVLRYYECWLLKTNKCDNANDCYGRA